MTALQKLNKFRYYNLLDTIREAIAENNSNTNTNTNINTNSSSGSGTTNTAPVSTALFQPFSNSLSFTAFPLVMAQKQVNAPLTLTCSTVGAIPGASVLIRLIADGVQANTPIFSNAQQVTGSSGWDNRLGIINIIQMQFDGVGFYYSIVQTALGAILDLQAPTLLSSAINAAGTIVTLTFNEDLLVTSLPTSVNFTGATVLSSSILNKIATLNLSPAVASGTTANIAYTGTAIKDLAGNNASGFTTSVTVAPVSVITPVNLASRLPDISEVVLGTYKKTGLGSWQVAASSTLNFTGDKTYEVSDVTLSSSQAIIGLDTRTTVDSNFIYQSLKLGISYYGGSYKAFVDGNQTPISGNHQPGDRMRLTRTAGVLKAQLKRGVADWTDLFTFPSTPTSTGALSTCLFLDDLNSQLSLILV